jgi:hypothetical protein
VSPVGSGAVTAATATGPLAFAVGVWLPWVQAVGVEEALQAKTYHQPCRPPWTTSLPVPSSKSEMTFAPAAGQVRLAVPPVPVVPALPVVPAAPVLPAVPLPFVPAEPLPLVPAVPVVLTLTQTLLVQVCPVVQAWPQLPQLLVLLVVSRQVPLQTCWPCTEQVQVPPVQVVPPEQIVPQVPQFPLSV